MYIVETARWNWPIKRVSTQNTLDFSSEWVQKRKINLTECIIVSLRREGNQISSLIFRGPEIFLLQLNEMVLKKSDLISPLAKFTIGLVFKNREEPAGRRVCENRNGLSYLLSAVVQSKKRNLKLPLYCHRGCVWYSKIKRT